MERKYIKKFDLFPYLLLAPSVIMILLVTAYPVATNLYLSFFDLSFTKSEVSFVFFLNYLEIIQESQIFHSIAITILWTIANMVFMSVLGIASALFLDTKTLGHQLLQSVLLVPWILPQIVTGFIWSLMLSQNMGIINEMLFKMHIVSSDFTWFQTGQMAFWAVVIANSWRGFPFFALMLYARLQSIPTEQIEAAKIDGAGYVSTLRYIVFPYLVPVYLTCLLLAFIWTFNAFDVIYIMTNGGPLEKTLTLALLIQREAFSYTEISRASTMSIIMFICLFSIITLSYLVYKIFRRYNRK